MSAARAMLHLPSERRLMESLERSCRDALSDGGFDLSGIDADKWGECLRAYGRVFHRSVEPRPRAVQRSRELEEQLRLAQNRELVACVRAVEEEMREGLDLNMRLSRKYYDASYNDPLLNDLNVHHFHLGARSNSPKKLCKSFGHDLLFGVVEKDTVHLVHLGDHASFRKVAFEDIMFENWRHLFEELSGIIPGPQPMASEDRATARHCGLTVTVQFNGKSYRAPWSGQTTSGTSIWVNHRVNSLIHQVRSGRDWLLDRADWVLESLRKHGHTSRTLALQVKVAGLTVWFTDSASGLWVCPSRGEMRFTNLLIQRGALGAGGTA